MSTVSLCMIVKNEEDVLARCLESVADLMDEIIIVDTGSTDKTKEIAQRYTKHVVDFAWIDDFAAARNRSFSLATMDYCMWLDADDVLMEEDRQALAALKEELDGTVQVVMLKYHTAFDAQGKPSFSYYRERLIRNHSGMHWKGAVHEAISPIGQVIYRDCAVTHSKLHPSDPDRNLRIFERMVAEGQTLEPREEFYFARELYYHARYEEALTWLEHFLDGGRGWRENCIDACSHCAYCLYQLGRPEEALRALLRSLAYDVPRAELSCEIARHFFDREQFDAARYWYLVALSCQRDDSRGGFVSLDCYGYLPCIQLCVCYDRLGEADKAQQFNEMAASFKPDEPAVLQNRAYFEGRLLTKDN